MKSVLAASVLFLFVNPQAPAPFGGGAGLSGYVLAPDGTPVSEGTVVARAQFATATASIDNAGRFRAFPVRAGIHNLVVDVPGFAPYRAIVIVPPSRSLRLPAIRLRHGAYFRVRFVSVEGEPILAPQLRRRLFDVAGAPIADSGRDRISNQPDIDGAITVGPMPRGIMTVAADAPGFARTRLPDVEFGEATSMVDGGTVVLEQPGGVLHVDVVDEAGAPVADHEVRLEDPRPRSPLAFEPARTNEQGRATFDRLAGGRYRLWTTASGRCANVLLATSQLVAVSGSGTIRAVFVVGGQARFRITSPFGPARAVPISASPNVPAPPLANGFRPLPTGCRGATDADGRVTLTNFPPGPAHVDVRLANSTYVRQVDVPDGREIAVAIPDGLLSVHVVDAITKEPIAGAAIAWTSGGARVEATATVTGDALLEGVGASKGTLAASAPGYQAAEEPLAEPPGLPHTIALAPTPARPSVRCRVITASGDPVPNAVVELTAPDVPRVAATDANGVVTFSDVPSGPLQLAASADGFAPSSARVGKDGTSEMVLRAAAK